MHIPPIGPPPASLPPIPSPAEQIIHDLKALTDTLAGVNYPIPQTIQSIITDEKNTIINDVHSALNNFPPKIGTTILTDTIHVATTIDSLLASHSFQLFNSQKAEVHAAITQLQSTLKSAQ
ncbi:MAG: hypothetical protein HY860_01200 [Chlamydiales bacterium]|nr:hypothetical protein [Chlamydiales bacterium]